MKIMPLLIASVVATGVQAQTPAPLPPADEQVAAAVLPLPNDLRGGAKVLGYRTAGHLEQLRDGTNGMICLALYVVRTDFHVACYHSDLEPFMARGRELRAQGVTGNAVDSVRFAEISSGKLKMPPHGALYSLTGPKSTWDATSRTVKGARPLAVVYMPFVTTQNSGVTSVPSQSGTPWLMFPGTAKAHIMILGTMTP
jgi:hypothetical protein